ncbi:hypothetical protein [Nocardia sp. NPDC050435]|uniref:hypothetical protein n=1 Tax=Nocardia sp. NPDC050435 TaxID=3155040 RepID=UPI0033DB99D9
MIEPADFVVLGMDGTAVYGRGDTDAMLDALDVDSMRLASSGIDPIQIWSTHTGSEPNPLSHQVLTALGHRDPDGWMGPIVLTTREDPKWVCQPFAEDVRTRVDEVVIAAGGTVPSTSAVSTPENSVAALAPGSDPSPAADAEQVAKPAEITAAIDAALDEATADPAHLDPSGPETTPPGPDHTTTFGPDMA